MTKNWKKMQIKLFSKSSDEAALVQILPKTNLAIS
jgi:hypothetical protein